jgi:hypothetical protein
MSLRPKRQPRCDESGRAYAGSQRQIQFYVNHQPDILNRAINEALKQSFQIAWVSPLKPDRYREYKDEAFLAALEQSGHAKKLKEFWPKNGPRWDALARTRTRGALAGGVLLGEAKSHLSEVYAGACTATSDRSLELIDSSLELSKKWLSAKPSVNWRGHFTFHQNEKEKDGCLYQMANRIAHLYLFREVLGIDAWLVNICFLDDPYHPTSRAEWEAGLAQVKRDMGLVGEIPFYADVFLPAGL